MSKRLFAGTLALAATGLLGAEAAAFVESYNPLTDRELSTRVQMRAVQDRCGPGVLPDVGPSGVYVASGGDNLVLSGTDRALAPWSVEVRSFGLGCSMWSADLDADGTWDLVVAGRTGGRGLVPPVQLAVLLFDGAGRPVPWEVDGFFEVDDRGVRDILDMDGDDRAEVVRMSYDDGYWITSPYEARDARWLRVLGLHGGLSFPLYTRFTRWPNRTPSEPSPDRSPRDADLTNIVPPAAGPARISVLSWSDPPLSRGPLLLLSDGRTCTGGAGEASSVTVVVDRPGGRDVAILGASARARALLEEVTLRQLPVVLAGRAEMDQCSPQLVWAFQTSY